MNKIIFFLVFFIVNLISNEIDNEIKKEASGAILKMAKELKSKLKENLKSGGVEKAANFCLNNAFNIVKKVNQTYPKGISVKRVSLKYRNPANKPSDDEAKVLKQIQSEYEAKKEIPKMIVKEVSKNFYKVYKPIFLNKDICLTCHGGEKIRDEKAYKLIKQKYPKDKAIDYKMGDLRGAFVVDIVKK